MRTIRVSAAAAVTLLTAACGDNNTQASSVNTPTDEVTKAPTQKVAPATVVAADEQKPVEYTAEFIQQKLIPAFKETAPIKIDEDMSITRLDADGRKLFYVLDYHPRNRKAVIPAEMQSYLNSLTGSVCQSASNQELLPKVETLGYRMEYNGQKIAESLCPSAAK